MALSINSIVTLEISPGIESTDADILSSEYLSYFTTEMAPMYSSVAEIRRLVGSYIPDIPDDIINQLIYTHSVIAESYASCSIDQKWEGWARSWVTYKTAITSLTNSDLFVGSLDGKVFKQLGDFSVSKEPISKSGADLSRLLNALECELYKYEFAIRNCMPPLTDCLGMNSVSGRVEVPKLAQLVEKGSCDPNKFISGRRWLTQSGGDITGRDRLIAFGKKYSINRNSDG